MRSVSATLRARVLELARTESVGSIAAQAALPVETVLEIIRISTVGLRRESAYTKRDVRGHGPVQIPLAVALDFVPGAAASPPLRETKSLALAPRVTEPDISVVIPAHNEAANLEPLVAEILRVEREMGCAFQIVIIDDASSDETAAVLERLKRHPEVTTRRMRTQSGQSAALAAGFDIATAPIIVTMDADRQNDPADIPALAAELERSDAAVGWRKNRKDESGRKLVSRVANRLLRWMTGETAHDAGCALKAFHRKCIERVPRFDGMHRFLTTLIRMQGHSIKEVVVNHRPRERGVSHYTTWNRLFRTVVDLLALKWLQARTLKTPESVIE